MSKGDQIEGIWGRGFQMGMEKEGPRRGSGSWVAGATIAELQEEEVGVCPRCMWSLEEKTMRSADV